MFGAWYLPAALIGSLSFSTVVFIVLANSVFGLIAGGLYWKRGLGAAVSAHIGAHVSSDAVATFLS